MTRLLYGKRYGVDKSMISDIVIAGGGTTACVIACRLAEAFPQLSIVIVEHGGDIQGDERTKRPLDGMFRYKENSPEISYVQSVTSEHCGGRGPIVPVGKILGGSSSINFMMYNNAAASDFDDWNTPGWSYKELLHCIQKSEAFSVPGVPTGDHGRDGVMRISNGGHQTPYAQEFFDAFKEAHDLPKVDDLTDYHTGHGCGYFPKLISKTTGYRSNVAQSYLYDRSHGVPGSSSNVKILTHHKVDRVAFDGDQAVGLDVIDHSAEGASERITVKARKKVLICAGAFGSPAILERSGIGSKRLLEGLGIEVKVDLPGVGENYQDHELTICSYHVTEDTETLDDYPREVKSIKEAADEEWRTTGKGMAATNGMDFGYKIRPSEEDIKTMGPEFEKHWRAVAADKPDKPLYSGPLVPYFMGPHPRPSTGRFISMGAFSNYPASRGSTHIKSRDAEDGVVFDSGLLSHPADLPVHVWAYKMQREVARRLPFVPAEHPGSHPNFPPNSKAALTPLPLASSTSTSYANNASPPPSSPLRKQEDPVGKIKYSPQDDLVISEWVRQTAGTAYHSMSTCSMKPRSAGGVVDGKLDVYGVKGLKVADLSICPENLGTNTTTVALIIGEKCALLLEEELRSR